MAEPLKLIYNPTLISEIADQFAAKTPDFDRDRFLTIALHDLDALEMMARAAQITKALEAVLPGDFATALDHLCAVLHPEQSQDLEDLPLDGRGLRGWAVLPLGSYVARRGLADPDAALLFLRDMTMRFSAEFAVRPFFRDHPKTTLAHAKRWMRDANIHVRRLASEGSRPRLPWGLRLGAFVDDPTPIFPILEHLKDDPAEYVRRSVANNLNDIAKDHPALVADIAARWMRDAPKARARLVKHACRSLIKAGHPATLAIFGYLAPGDLGVAFQLAEPKITLGETLNVSAVIKNNGDQDMGLLIDLVVYFRKANGSLSPKVFKWTEVKMAAGAEMTVQKPLALRPVTTRVHYAGGQEVALQVNGRELGRCRFELVLP